MVAWGVVSVFMKDCNMCFEDWNIDHRWGQKDVLARRANIKKNYHSKVVLSSAHTDHKLCICFWHQVSIFCMYPEYPICLLLFLVSILSLTPLCLVLCSKCQYSSCFLNFIIKIFRTIKNGKNPICFFCIKVQFLSKGKSVWIVRKNMLALTAAYQIFIRKCHINNDLFLFYSLRNKCKIDILRAFWKIPFIGSHQKV